MHSEGLADEFNFYLENQKAIVSRYNGKIVVIKGGEILGAYDTPLEAIVETQKQHALGTFLIQAVSPGQEAYTHSYSRALRRL